MRCKSMPSASRHICRPRPLRIHRLWKVKPQCPVCGHAHPDCLQARLSILPSLVRDALMIVSEATELQHRTHRMIAIECAILWAAIRRVEQQRAESDVLSEIRSADVEAEYCRCFREFDPSKSDSAIETEQAYNALYLLPSRCRPWSNCWTVPSHQRVKYACGINIQVQFRNDHKCTFFVTPSVSNDYFSL